MGHIRVTTDIANPSDPARKASEEALIDTGATFSVLPRRLLTQLGLEITGQTRVKTASGEEELPRSRAFFTIGGRSEITPVLIRDKVDTVLIGVFTLEALVLSVNPVTGELQEMELLLYPHRVL